MGLQINLKKGGVSKPGASKPKITFAFGGNGSTKLNKSKLPSTAASLQRKNVLAGESDSEDEDKIIAVKGFDQEKGGVLSSDSAVQKTAAGPVVITLNDLSTKIRRRAPPPPQEHTEDFEIPQEEALLFGLNKPVAKEARRSSVDEPAQSAMTRDERIRLSLLKGERLERAADLRIPKAAETTKDAYAVESTREDYDAVPVEHFGAALLRGMGWNGHQATAKPKKEPNHALVEKRQRSVVLGIGAKPIESDLVDDLFGKRGLKFEVPLLKRNKETGEVVTDQKN